MQHIRRVQVAEEGQDTRAGQVIVPVVTAKAVSVKTELDFPDGIILNHIQGDCLVCSHD